jgi:rRNA maturation endonuclease Nob1
MSKLENKSKAYKWLYRKLCWHEFEKDWEYGNMQVHICKVCGKHIVTDKAESDLKAK